MAEERNICEETKIAIYSDAELTDEHKKHINSCEECRALLSQITALKDDLGNLSVSGITKGCIADAVMSEIRSKKTSVTFPKFSFTHHIGTAAAIAIILVAALMIKNPQNDNFEEAKSQQDAAGIVFEDSVNNHILSETPDAQMHEDAVFLSSSSNGTKTADQESENIIMYSAFETEKADGTQIAEPKENVVYDITADADAYTEEESAAESTEEKPKLMFRSPPPSANTDFVEEQAAPISTDEEADGNVQEDNDVPSAGGGGGSVSELTSATNNTAKLSKTKDNGFIFEGIDFLEGEENFEYNISLANARLYELYGDGYVISRQKLKKLGVDNAKLLELSSTVTEEMFNFYKTILDIFE